MTRSLKADILEHLVQKPGKKNLSSNTGKAKTAAPQARGKSPIRENAAPKKKGDKVLYEGKPVTIQSINETTGMAIVKMPRLRDPKIVRLVDLTSPQGLNEAWMGMAPILPTWKEATPSVFMRGDLSADDIGLEIISLREDDDSDEKDDQEEDHDNGSNVRHDGHSGKKEVDELPTPSDTIAPAYSDEIPPKIVSRPLSTEPGVAVATDPDMDGYDYPADAPEIPKADFEGDDNGNSRAPNWTDNRGNVEHFKGKSKDNNKHETTSSEVGKKAVDESFNFIAEMDDLLGKGEDREPSKGDTITVTLPALASIVCTVANRCQGDQELLRSMIEALDEVGNGKTIDVGDLEAVAAHMNGEETEEVMNRDGGGSDHGDDHGDHHGSGDDDHDSHGAPSEWPGDGDKSNGGKTKLLGGVHESEEKEDKKPWEKDDEEEEVEECDADMNESSYYGWNDMVNDHRKPTEEEEFRAFKRRAGLRFW